jgi:hypothetical protein
MRTLAGLACLFVISNACGAYRCVDASGKTHVGDTPPAACDSVTTYEISHSGTVVRRIEPASAVKLAERASAGKERASEDARRRDRALVDGYSSVHEIELARDRALEMIRGRLEATDVRIRQIEQRERDLQRVIASYRGGAIVPKPVTANLEAAQEEKASAAAARARQQNDLEATRVKFEDDRKRWTELRQGR